jgi:hypothetical protein
MAAGPYTPTIRGYTKATVLENTDAFVIDRLGFGTMYIEGGNLTGNATGNLTVTDSTNTVTLVTEIIFSGAVVSPSSGTGTATVTISALPPAAIAFQMIVGD